MPITSLPLPPYLLGRHLVGVTVAGVTINADGTFTVSTVDTANLGNYGPNPGRVLEGFRINPVSEAEDITPIDVRARNNVTVADDFKIEATEMQAQNALSVLWAIKAGYDYARFQRNYARNVGGTATTTALAVIGRVGELTETPARGKTLVSLTLDSAGLAPYYGPVTGLPF